MGTEKLSLFPSYHGFELRNSNVDRKEKEPEPHFIVMRVRSPAKSLTGAEGTFHASRGRKTPNGQVLATAA
jgi:hypothetical protein